MVLALLWYGQLGNRHPNNAWVESAIAVKLGIARQAGSPKVVLLAGSGTMFGVDSHRLEQKYHVPTVNMGVNAGISLPAILQTAKEGIGPGDLVILPLEYPLYNLDEPVSRTLVDWMNGHPEMLPWLAWEKALKVIVQTPFSRILEGYRGIPDGFAVNGFYGPQHFDGRGDQTDSSRSRRTAGDVERVRSLPPERYGQLQDDGRYAWATLTSFRDWLLQQGACPIFVPPPMAFRESYRSVSREYDFYTELKERAREQGLFWLGDPYQAMRDENDFFDTNYHLVDEAREQYTQLLIDWLGDTPRKRCMSFYQAMSE